MLDIAKIALFLAAAIFAGYNVIFALAHGRGRLYVPENIALSFGIGTGLISIEMLSFYFFKLEFTLAGILLPWTALFAVNIILYWRNRKKSAPAPFSQTTSARGSGRRPGALTVFLCAGIVFEVLYALFRALIKPIESYDAIAIYAIKSKIFYMARSISHDFFTRISPLFPHQDYPLNIPLVETLGYIFLGRIDEIAIKVIFPFYFIAVLTMIYYAIRRFASRDYALAFTFLLASVPQFNAYATNGYLDLPLAYYSFSSSAMLFLYFRDPGKSAALYLSAIMAGLAGWTKNEGLLYCVVNIFVLLIFCISEPKGTSRRKLGASIAYIAITAAILLPWFWIKRAYSIANDEIQFSNLAPSAFFGQFYKLKPILYEFQKHIFGPKKWNLIWMVFLFALFARYREALKGVAKYVSISLALVMSGYVLAYMLTRVEIRFALSTSGSRFLLHFLPLAIYWLSILLKKDIES